MDKEVFGYKRKSYIEIDEVFFWTATINQWQKLLLPDEYKDVVIRSLEYLSNTGKIDVYAFVIMPNHIHLIWKTNELNGKETAQVSFLKYTAREFRKILSRDGQLNLYKVGREIKSMSSGNGIHWGYTCIPGRLLYKN